MTNVKEKILGKQEWDEEHRFQIKLNGRYVSNFELPDNVYDFTFYEGDWYNLMQIVTILNAFEEQEYHGVTEIIQRSKI